MADFDYSEILGKASELISRFGRQLVLRIKQSGGDGWNPVIGWDTSTYKGVQVALMREEADGTVVKSGDIKYLMQAEFGEIKLADRVIDGDIEYNIVKVKPLYPGDTRLLSTVYCRK